MPRAHATPLTRRNFLSLDFGDRRGAGDHWIRVHRVAMACRFEVMLSSEDAGDMSAARAALDKADELEALLTVFRDTSATSDLNRRAAREIQAAVLRSWRTSAFLVANSAAVRSWPLAERR